MATPASSSCCSGRPGSDLNALHAQGHADRVSRCLVEPHAVRRREAAVAVEIDALDFTLLLEALEHRFYDAAYRYHIGVAEVEILGLRAVVHAAHIQVVDDLGLSAVFSDGDLASVA